MNKKRLLKLADFLDKLPRKKFDFGEVVFGPDKPNKELSCRSVACAVGWCPIVFPKIARYKRRKPQSSYLYVGLVGKRTKYFSDTPRLLFDITHDEARGLFIPGWQDEIGLPYLQDRATPKQVATNIRRFVAKNSK